MLRNIDTLVSSEIARENAKEIVRQSRETRGRNTAERERARSLREQALAVRRELFQVPHPGQKVPGANQTVQQDGQNRG